MRKAQLQKQLTRDVGPQRSEAHVQHVDGAADAVALHGGLHHRQLDHAVRRNLRPHLLKGDGPAGQTRAGVGVDVAPMEGIAFAGTRQAVHRFVDHARLRDAADALDVRKGAVVRGNHVLPRRRAHRDGAPGRAHAGVHYADKHTALRPVAHRLNQPVAGLPDVILGDVMRKIEHAQRTWRIPPRRRIQSQIAGSSAA